MDMTKTTLCVVLTGLLSGCSGMARGNQPQSTSQAEQADQLLLSETFDGDELPTGWWSEGGRRIFVQNGRLHLDADPPDDQIARDKHNIAATVWAPQVMAGNVRIEFDAHVESSQPDVCNINLFFFYAMPDGSSLYETRDQRADGAYAHYHELNGYILTFLRDYPSQREYHPDGTPKARFRLRRCPGFQLLSETRDYNCQVGRTYRLTVTRVDGRITCTVDGNEYVAADDAQPLEAGQIAFRTFRTHVWFDNLRVTRLP